MITLSTAEEATKYLNSLILNEVEADLDINFAGELEFISITITGKDFHHSITGELARGIADFQDEIYKAAKFAFYGREGRIQLEPDSKQLLEFNFTVNEGSSDLETPTNTVAKGLSSGLSHMESKHLAITIIAAALILTTGFVGYTISNNYSKNQETTQIEATKSTQQKEETIRQQQIINGYNELAKTLKSAPPEVKKIIQRVDKATQEGNIKVLRSVPRAEKVSINGYEYDHEFISYLRARAPRSLAESVDVTDKFRVFADTNINPVRLTLSGSVIPGEFYADFPDDIDAETQNLLWEVIKRKGELEMVVRINILRDKLKGGVILDIPTPRTQEAQS